MRETLTENFDRQVAALDMMAGHYAALVNVLRELDALTVRFGPPLGRRARRRERIKAAIAERHQGVLAKHVAAFSEAT